ncbi:MAG: tetratricopeptide repeat protein [Parachlamydiaceae bacterium]
MRYFVCCLLLFGALHSEELDVQAKRAFDRGRYKEAIELSQKLITEAPQEKKAGYLVKLAMAEYKDQEHGKAIETYLKAMNLTPKPKEPYKQSEEDAKLYKEALALYLNPRERDSKITALRIHEVYAGILRMHPEYVDLGFIVATSCANLDRFEEFFQVFYTSYTQNPDHYLAYKTRAILLIKLFERAKTIEEKNRERKRIEEALQQAKDRYPLDSSLYRLQIAYAPMEEKKEILRKNLNEIFAHSIVIPRSEMSFYFDQLFAYGEEDMAKKLLEKARGWYPYSRTLDAAKEMLEENK